MSSDKWLCIQHSNRRQLFEASTNSDDDDELNSFEVLCGHSHDNSRSMITALNASTSETISFPMEYLTGGQANPSKPLIALSNEGNIFIKSTYDRKCVAWTRFPCEAEFWTWLTEDIIAVVGANDVFHWNINEESFSWFSTRDFRLKDCQITGYKADKSLHWFALTGLCADKG